MACRAQFPIGPNRCTTCAMDTISFGARLRTLRKAKGLSQVQLSKAVGVSQNAISLIERGRGYPTIETADAIAQALGVPIEDLFAFMSEKRLSPKRREMLTAVLDVARGLDDKALAKLMARAEELKGK